MSTAMRKLITLDAATKAAETLGLELVDVSEHTVTGAFRHAVRIAHPDAGVPMPDGAAGKIQAALEARTLLRKWIAAQPDQRCVICQGRGSVRSGPFSSAPCPRCQKEET